MPSFLVLGAAGQLGSELTRLLPADDTLALTREQLDITDFAHLSSVLRQVRPKVVFNCTGFVKVDAAEENPEEAWREKRVAVGVLGEECPRHETTLVPQRHH